MGNTQLTPVHLLGRMQARVLVDSERFLEEDAESMTQESLKLLARINYGGIATNDSQIGLKENFSAVYGPIGFESQTWQRSYISGIISKSMLGWFKQRIAMEDGLVCIFSYEFSTVQGIPDKITSLPVTIFTNPHTGLDFYTNVPFYPDTWEGVNDFIPEVQNFMTPENTEAIKADAAYIQIVDTVWQRPLHLFKRVASILEGKPRVIKINKQKLPEYEALSGRNIL